MIAGSSRIALAVSSAVHGLAILSFFLSTSPTTGVGGQQLDAISVEIVRSDSLGDQPDPRRPLAPATASSTGEEGPQGDIDQEAVAAQTANAKPEPDKQPEALAPDVTDRKPEAEAPLITAEEDPSRPSETKVAEPTKDEPSEPLPETSKPVTLGTVDQAAADASTKGGPDSAATQPALAPPSGVPAASPGEVAAYGMAVQKALKKNRPRHAGRKGRVGISFSINADGTLRDASVAKSSGKQRLDEAVIAAVRSAKFPKPPKGMSETQLSYSISIDFK